MQDEEKQRVQNDMSFKIFLLNGTAEVVTLIVNPNTVKTGTDLQIRLIETTPQMNFSLLKEIPGTVKVTS